MLYYVRKQKSYNILNIYFQFYQHSCQCNSSLDSSTIYVEYKYRKRKVQRSAAATTDTLAHIVTGEEKTHSPNVNWIHYKSSFFCSHLKKPPAAVELLLQRDLFHLLSLLAFTHPRQFLYAFFYMISSVLVCLHEVCPRLGSLLMTRIKHVLQASCNMIPEALKFAESKINWKTKLKQKQGRVRK